MGQEGGTAAPPFAFIEHPSDVDPTRPLIYLWDIRDANGTRIECYVGKASRGARRPRRDYANNVRRLRAGLPWHGRSGRNYRPIHHALSRAGEAGLHISLTLIRNVEPGEDIDALEREERARNGCVGR